MKERFFSNKGLDKIEKALKKQVKKNPEKVGNYYEYLTPLEISIIKNDLEEEGYRVAITKTGEKNATLITVFAK